SFSLGGGLVAGAAGGASSYESYSSNAGFAGDAGGAAFGSSGSSGAVVSQYATDAQGLFKDPNPQIIRRA
ncbi:unnamed protein product, partial [Rotaria magnacalcarata]